MRRNDETWSERLVQRRTHIGPYAILMKSIARNGRLHFALNIFKHLSCKPGRFIQRSGNLRMIRAICHGKMTGPFEASFSWRPAWPFWSLSLHYPGVEGLRELWCFNSSRKLTCWAAVATLCYLWPQPPLLQRMVFYVFSSKPAPHPCVWEGSDFASRAQVIERLSST